MNGTLANAAGCTRPSRLNASTKNATLTLSRKLTSWKSPAVGDCRRHEATLEPDQGRLHVSVIGPYLRVPPLCAEAAGIPLVQQLQLRALGLQRC